MIEFLKWKQSNDCIIRISNYKSKQCTHLVPKATQYKIVPTVAMYSIAYHPASHVGLPEVQENLDRIDQLTARLHVQESFLFWLDFQLLLEYPG